jgi:hypothetical protein
MGERYYPRTMVSAQEKVSTSREQVQFTRGGVFPGNAPRGLYGGGMLRYKKARTSGMPYGLLT